MSTRKMVYPYTFCAKLALFPYSYYYKNSPFFKWTIWAVVFSLPLSYKIQKLVCSEANYLKYAEYQRKEREEYERHNEHLD